MRNITEDIRHLASDPDWDCGYKYDAWEFIRDVVKEYDDNQIAVDAEWLDDLWMRGGSQFTWNKEARHEPFIFEWNFRESALSTTAIQVRFIGKTEDFDESWAVYANHALLKSDPTRGDIRSLLNVVGGHA